MEARDRARALLAAVRNELPSEVRTASGQTIHVERVPGMAAGMMEELRPFLAEQGVDLDDAPDLAGVQSALDIAVERRNAQLFDPSGARRTAAAAALRTSPRRSRQAGTSRRGGSSTGSSPSRRTPPCQWSPR